MIEDKENINQETDNLNTEESTTDTSSEVEKTEEEVIKAESKEEKSEQKDSKDDAVEQDSSNDDTGTSVDKTNSDEEVSTEESLNVNESARFILGKKVGMTSIYSEDGQQFPATVIEAGPCYVSQVKTDENDGYNAVQIGYVFDKKANKPKVNHFKKNNCDPMRYSKEFRRVCIRNRHIKR